MRPLVPELRFPEFKGPWKPARAGDAFRNSKAKGEAGLPIYSVTQDRGLVRRDSLERHMGADAADETNLRAQPGDLVYNMMRMWQGAVGMASEECMVSPAYVVLAPEKGISSKFFDYWFQNRHMLHQLWAYSHGLTNDRLRLYYQDFAKIPLALPDQPEQEKIGAVLDATSRKITLLIDKKTALEDYKRGLMQRLFSRELRFTRDDGSAFPDWEERRLSKMFRERSERGNPTAELLSVTMHNGVRRASDVARAQEASVDRSNYKCVCSGDIAYNSMRMWQGANGLSEYDGIVSPAYTVVTPNCGQIPKFWAYYFKFPPVVNQFRKYSQGLTKDTWNLKFPLFGEIKVMVPHPDEQRKIAATFSVVDAKIDALSQKISEMEAFKKGLLQKLFV